MAISRFFSKSPLFLPPHPIIIPSIHTRNRSGKAHQAQLIEFELDSSQNDTVEVVSSIRNLEEILQSIIARRAAPDWLPFLPGYSYYVPPPPAADRPGKLFEVLGRLSEAQGVKERGFSGGETMSFRSNVGWPSSTYFIEAGTAPTHPLPMGLAMEVKIYDSEEAAQESSSEEE